MKVVIIELEHHDEIVNEISSMLKYQKIHFKIGASEEILKFVDHDHKFTLMDNSSISKLVLDEDIDVIIWTTLLPNHFKYINKIRSTKIIGLIHNTNTFFSPQNNRSHTIKDLILLLARAWDRRGKLKLINKMDAMGFPEEWMMAEKNKSKSYQLPLVYNRQISIPKNEKVHIGIHGGINKRNRNYEILFQALKLMSHELHNRINLTFIGQSSERDIEYLKNKISSISNSKIDCTFFQGYLPPKEYDKVLSDIDFLLVICKEKYNLGGIYEYYGITNITGAQLDMVKYATPAIFPDFYPLDKILSGISGFYSNVNDLSRLLTEWIINKTHNTFNRERVLVYEQYSLDNTSNKLIDILKQVVSTPLS